MNGWNADMVFKLEPFLTPIEWYSLSLTDTYFNNICNTKKTLFEKFKKQVLEQNHIETILNALNQVNGVISGSFALCMFTGDSWFNDIDIFYDNDDVPLLELEGFERRWNTPGDEYRSVSPHIDHIAEYESKDNLHVQFISAGNRNTCEFCETIEDIIFLHFDLDFCKIFFTSSYLKICNPRSILDRKSCLHFQDKIRYLVPYDKTGYFSKLASRIQKYRDRGFHVDKDGFDLFWKILVYDAEGTEDTDDARVEMFP